VANRMVIGHVTEIKDGGAADVSRFYSLSVSEFFLVVVIIFML